jgi:hypothetical protein
MHRPRYASGFLLAPILFTLVFFTFACGGGGPEQNTIQKFFQSSRLRDNMTLGGMARVAFDPTKDGIVEGFNVVSVSEPQVQPLHLKELAATHQAAVKARDDQNKKQADWQAAHPEEFTKAVEAQRKGLKLKGKDAEAQVAWDKFREDSAALEKRVSEARDALQTERDVADMSTNNPANPVDATQYDGEMTTREYTINANVQTPDGQHVKKTLIVTLQQAKLRSDKGDITGKWIITKIKDTTGGATS